jgi:hypothetical protein
MDESQGMSFITNQPAWFDLAKLHKELDAREMLAAGEHPVNQVMADLKQLPPGKIYRLVAPFLPAPLIDKASSISLNHWVNQVSDNEFEVYFYKEE